MRLKIKRSYHKETKEILRELRPYTNYINGFIICFQINNDFIICDVTINWKYNDKLKSIKLNNWYDKKSEVLNEVIEALTTANHNIYYEIGKI